MADAFLPSLESFTPSVRAASAEKQRYWGGLCCLSAILLSIKALYPKAKAMGFRAGFLIRRERKTKPPRSSQGGFQPIFLGTSHLGDVTFHTNRLGIVTSKRRQKTDSDSGRAVFLHEFQVHFFDKKQLLDCHGLVGVNSDARCSSSQRGNKKG